ncbi:leucine-rich repeat-containing protein 74A isoform X2 [Lingula anatina]|uniref:Leucine-rich repeat-containing protein 74A isoform X2 n=1 Tax=Lingula anatina TaxID=7574 RepID=A0A1S3JZU4_LINAN|nr:leucine-rich repeat-containing protein 74A isoform X2 [Lingula anatina]|eukprot:XP_013415903.1 leucine-rich repeat-containing protein 74A isoform X2 [Lingula anatina]
MIFYKKRSDNVLFSSMGITKITMQQAQQPPADEGTLFILRPKTIGGKPAILPQKKIICRRHRCRKNDTSLNGNPFLEKDNVESMQSNQKEADAAHSKNGEAKNLDETFTSVEENLTNGQPVGDKRANIANIQDNLDNLPCSIDQAVIDRSHNSQPTTRKLDRGDSLEYTSDEESDISSDIFDDISAYDSPLPSHTPLAGETLNQRTYLAACQREHVTPSTLVYRRLTTTTLDLSHHPLGPQGAKALAIALVNNIHVTDLRLRDVGLGRIGALYITEMLQENLFITTLNLAENDIGSEATDALCNVLQNNKLIRTLDLSGNFLTDVSAERLCVMLHTNETVRDLRVRRNCFCEKGGIAFGKVLVDNASLVCLDLSWNHIRRKGAIAICKGIQGNSTLRKLNLAWNGLELDGCRALALSLCQNAALLELDIRANRISLEALRGLLKGIAKNETLKVLKIGVNPLTTDGATEILRELMRVGTSGLRHLDLTDVSVDEEFVLLLQELRNIRPLHIQHGVMLRHDALEKVEVDDVVDSENPVSILFEYMRQENMRLIDLFHVFDRTNSDNITRAEFRDGFTNINITLSSRALDVMMKQLDKNGDGVVSFEPTFSENSCELIVIIVGSYGEFNKDLGLRRAQRINPRIKLRYCGKKSSA